jgi:glucose 1-dehydrogenase
VRLEHKVAIVTGAGTGIGRAIALRFVQEGAAVVIDYVGKPDNAAEVVQQITGAGGKALAVEADVSQQDQVQRLIDQTVQKFDRLDILVNNAGVETKIPFLEIPLDVWSRTIAIDLTGPFLCAQAAAKRMVGQGGGGRIINISSVH